MRRILAALALIIVVLVAPAQPAAATVTPLQVYGAWHCGNDFCAWGAVRTVTEFDAQNHWLVDRGDGRPSVNVVVLLNRRCAVAREIGNDSGNASHAQPVCKT